MPGGYLVVLDRSGRAGRQFQVSDGVATIGRAPACDIRVLLDTVAPHHATIVVHSNQTIIRNAGDGETLVNGRAISVAALQHDDVITVGGRCLRWQYDSPPSGTPLKLPEVYKPVRSGRTPRRVTAAALSDTQPHIRKTLEMQHRASMPGNAGGSAGAGGKQVAIVQPQRRDASEPTENQRSASNSPRSPNRSRSSRTDDFHSLDSTRSPRYSPHTPSPNPSPNTTQNLSKTKTNTPKSTPNIPQTTTKATLWIESRKTSPRKSVQNTVTPGGRVIPRRVVASAKKSTPLRLTVLRKAQSASKMKVTKIEGPLKIDAMKQAALMLMTGPSRRLSGPAPPAAPSLVVGKRGPTARGGRRRPRGSKGSRGSRGSRGSKGKSVSVLEITDTESTLQPSVASDTDLSTRSMDSQNDSPLLPSPKKSALKDPTAKRTSRKNESIKFDLSNLENYSKETNVSAVSTSSRGRKSTTPQSDTTDEEITLRYSDSSPVKSPSPRRSIHSRASKILELTGSTLKNSTLKNSTASEYKDTLTPESPRARKSSRGSIILQKALNANETNVSTYSNRTTKTLSVQSFDTTAESAFRTRTLSPKSARDLESYSIVDLVSVDSNESGSESVYDSVGSTRSSSIVFGTPQGSTRKTRSTIDPTLLTSSTPYVKKTRASIRSHSSSAIRPNSPNKTARASASTRRSKSLTTPENSEEIQKHISINSTRISRASRSRSRINDSDLQFLNSSVVDSESPKTSRRNTKADQSLLSPGSKSSPKRSTILESPKDTTRMPSNIMSFGNTVSLADSTRVSQESVRRSSPKSNPRLSRSKSPRKSQALSRKSSLGTSLSPRNSPKVSRSTIFESPKDTTRMPSNIMSFGNTVSLIDSTRVSQEIGRRSSPKSPKISRSTISKNSPRKSLALSRNSSLETSLSPRTSPKVSRSTILGSPKDTTRMPSNIMSFGNTVSLIDSTRVSRESGRRSSPKSSPNISRSTISKKSPRQSQALSRKSSLGTSVSLSESPTFTQPIGRTSSPKTSPRLSRSAISEKSLRTSQASGRLSLANSIHLSDSPMISRASGSILSPKSSPRLSKSAVSEKSLRKSGASARKSTLATNVTFSVSPTNSPARGRSSALATSVTFSDSPTNSPSRGRKSLAPSVTFSDSPTNSPARGRSSALAPSVTFSDSPTNSPSRGRKSTLGNSVTFSETPTNSPARGRKSTLGTTVIDIDSETGPKRSASQSSLRANVSRVSIRRSKSEISLRSVRSNLQSSPKRSVSQISPRRSTGQESPGKSPQKSPGKSPSPKKASTQKSPASSSRSRSSRANVTLDLTQSSDEGTVTPENTTSLPEAGTPVLSIQSLLDSSAHSSFVSQQSPRSSTKKRGSTNIKRKTIGVLRSGRKTKTTPRSKSFIVTTLSSLRSGKQSNLKQSTEENVTPKSAVKLVQEAVKNMHSTAKKPQSKRSIIDNLNQSDIVKQLFNSPVKRKLSQSMTEFSRKKLFEEDDEPRRQKRNTVALTGRTPDNSLLDNSDRFTPENFVSPLSTPGNSPNLSGIKRLYKRNTPQNDLSNIHGVKKLLRTPRTRKSVKNDLSNISGIKTVFAKSPRNRLSDVRVKEVFVASPRNDLRRVSGVKSLFQSERKRKSPRNDLEDVRGVKRLFTRKSAANDLRNVSGVKETLRNRSPRNDLRDVRGVKQVFRGQKRKKSADLSGVEALFDVSTVSNVSDRSAEALFDQLLGKPPIKKVYSKSFISKRPEKKKLRRNSLRKSIEVIVDKPEEWINQELQKRLQSKKSNIPRELQNLATDTVEGTEVRTSRIRNSTLLQSNNTNEGTKRIASLIYSAHTLPIKKRSFVEASLEKSASDSKNRSIEKSASKSKSRSSNLPIKKRALPHSTPVKTRYNFTMNASELDRMSPIAVLEETRSSKPEIVNRSAQPKSPKQAKRATKANIIEDTEQDIVEVSKAPKRAQRSTRGKISESVNMTKTSRSRKGAKSLQITKANVSVQKTPPQSPKETTKLSISKQRLALRTKGSPRVVLSRVISSKASPKVPTPKPKRGRPKKASTATVTEQPKRQTRKISEKQANKETPKKGRGNKKVEIPLEKAELSKTKPSPKKTRGTKAKSSPVKPVGNAKNKTDSAGNTNTKRRRKSLVITKKAPIMVPKSPAKEDKRATRGKAATKSPVKNQKRQNEKVKTPKATLVVGKPSPVLNPRTNTTKNNNKKESPKKPASRARRNAPVESPKKNVTKKAELVAKKAVAEAKKAEPVAKKAKNVAEKAEPTPPPKRGRPPKNNEVAPPAKRGRFRKDASPVKPASPKKPSPPKPSPKQNRRTRNTTIETTIEPQRGRKRKSNNDITAVPAKVAKTETKTTRGRKAVEKSPVKKVSPAKLTPPAKETAKAVKGRVRFVSPDSVEEVSPPKGKSKVDTSVRGKSKVISPNKAKSKVVSPAKGKAKVVSPPKGKSKLVSPAKGKSKVVSPAKGKSKPVSPAKGNSKTVSPVKGRSKSVPPVKGKSRLVSPNKGKSKAVSPAKGKSKAVSPAKGKSKVASPAKGKSKVVTAKGKSKVSPLKEAVVSPVKGKRRTATQEPVKEKPTRNKKVDTKETAQSKAKIEESVKPTRGKRQTANDSKSTGKPQKGAKGTADKSTSNSEKTPGKKGKPATTTSKKAASKKASPAKVVKSTRSRRR